MEEYIIELQFLTMNGFVIVEHDKSPYFGDFYCKYSNQVVLIILNSSKSFISFDLASCDDKESLFDLLIVRSLIFKEEVSEMSITSQINFLKDNLYEIINIFNKDKYKINKDKMIKLERKRASNRFPGW